MKIELTSFDVAVVVYELNNIITNARIENIYQINKLLLLKLHKPAQPALQLLVDSGKRVHLTNYVLDKPFKPPVFCMTLRKHLSGAVIEAVEQHEFERIIIFKIRTKQGTMQLIVELFGDGNIILTNAQGIIVTAMVFKRMRDRNILRNEAFRHAPKRGQNPFRLSRTQLDELRNLGQLETVRGLIGLLSIGGLYAEEVLLRAEVDKKTHCDALTEQQLDAIFAEIQGLLSLLQQGKLEPAIVIDVNGNFVDAIPTKLKWYEGLETKPHGSFNQALDEYFTQASQIVLISEAQKKYERELAKHQRMLKDQQTVFEEAKKAAGRNKRFGDLIYSHLSELQLLQQRILDSKRSGESWERIISRFEKEKQLGLTPAIYFDSFSPKNMILNVSIGDIVFPIQMTRSIQANAAVYYEMMKKAERKLEGAEKALAETQRKIEKLEKEWIGRREETRKEEPAKKLGKSWYEKFRWFVSSDGFLVLGGRDAITNEILIKKHLEPHDIVFHADVVGAPFVVIKTEGKPPTDQVIREAAQFAASYSRAWREMFGAVDVYWVHPSQVSKTAPSGQYLEKGAFVIQGARTYVRRVPLRVAIGLVKVDEQLRTVGGPAEAVHGKTDLYLELIPGNEPSAKLATQILHMLAEKANKQDREKISKVPIEEIQQFIPLGKGAIIRVRK